jgi:hypothetical protein
LNAIADAINASITSSRWSICCATSMPAPGNSHPSLASKTACSEMRDHGAILSRNAT